MFWGKSVLCWVFITYILKACLRYTNSRCVSTLLCTCTLLYVLNILNRCVYFCCYSPGTFRGLRHPRTCWSWWMREWRPRDSCVTVRFYFLFSARRPFASSFWLASGRWVLLRCAHGCIGAVTLTNKIHSIIYSPVNPSRDLCPKSLDLVWSDYRTTDHL